MSIPLAGKTSQDINPTANFRLDGENVARKVGKDMQAYSKSAHFQLGGQGGAKNSTQQSHFSHQRPTEGYEAKKQFLQHNIQNMRANHFDLAMIKADPTTSLSTSQLAKKVNSDASNRMRDFTSKEMKEQLDQSHWGHGVTERPKYNSINSASYIKPASLGNQSAQVAEVEMLKQRIGNHNFSYGNNALSKNEQVGTFQTSSGLVHKELGSANIDKKMISAQRVKLTKSNFQVGKSPLAFCTTNVDTHIPMRGEYKDPIVRLAMRDANNATNFINTRDGAFEKQIPPRGLGAVPDKNTGDSTAKVNEMITDLKASHFQVGYENGARKPANVAYGVDLKKHEPSSTEHPKGHGLQTHFIMGQDKPMRSSEAVTSFTGPFAKKDTSERDEIRTRMCGDSVTIGGPVRDLAKQTTSANYFYNKDGMSRRSNSNVQYTFMPNINALKSHYPQMDRSAKFMPGTEQKSKFTGAGNGPNPGLGQERLAFMRDAHFDHTNRSQTLGSATISKNQLPHYHDPAKINMNDSNAFRLRHQKLELGEQNQPTSYVTTNHLKVKWNQPTSVATQPAAGI